MVEAGVEFLPGMRKRPTMDGTLLSEKVFKVMGRSGEKEEDHGWI